jgi:hypothetical protein
MHELLHVLGLCGEPHPSLIAIASAIPLTIHYFYNYIKSLILWRKKN